ncbi:MAG: hypothetical protein JW809_07015 [Pirellulales bacterium]|nr:hypothetical protein [Pirellulales bacterium]
MNTDDEEEGDGEENADERGLDEGEDGSREERECTRRKENEETADDGQAICGPSGFLPVNRCR